MGKKNRQTKAKRSLGSLPKGLPQRKKRNTGTTGFADINPFENARASSAKNPKFLVHNRPLAGAAATSGPATSLARSMARRKESLRKALEQDKKAGSFVDRRIGEGPGMTEEQRMMARVVRERARISKKASRFALEGNDDAADGALGFLTHKGKAIDDNFTGKLSADDVILSDDDEDKYAGQLDRVDTEMHFGGGTFNSRKGKNDNPYGPSDGEIDMAKVYRSRKEELDDMIRRKKAQKAEKIKNKEEQLETFESLDESFKELAGLLQFRDKEKEKKSKLDAKRAGTLSQEDKDMDAWDKEMKGYLFERKVKATDRTKTPEESAKEEADRLQELETKRMARMNGDFEGDDLSDISDDEGRGSKGRKIKKAREARKQKMTRVTTSKADHRNPDELDSDEEETDEPEVRFTADGLVYVDKDGKVLKKVDGGEEGGIEHESEQDDQSEDETASESDDESSSDSIGSSDQEVSAGGTDEDSDEGSLNNENVILEVGAKVKGSYHAEEQYDGVENWYEGVITKVTADKKGNVLYDVTYDDGDFEEGMKPQYVRRSSKSKPKTDVEKEKRKDADLLKIKKQKAKKKARGEMPFVFDVPTTLEALHDLIERYASTGNDVSVIIERIHKANSVVLNKNNREKMQNFHDVLLRRFIEVGDAVYVSGQGGSRLCRYNQLDALSQFLFAMAQDSPACAGAVWGRRLGIQQKALAKRLRDSELWAAEDEDVPSAWPSTGSLLLLRALAHVFPVTDLRHSVVTPALILLGQSLAQCPVRSLDDIVMGIFCSGLMIEYSKEAKRIAPEALAFLGGVVRLFAVNSERSAVTTPLPCFETLVQIEKFGSLRNKIIEIADKLSGESMIPKLSIEKEEISREEMPLTILYRTLQLIEMVGNVYGGSINNAEAEAFDDISRSLLCLKPKSKGSPLPRSVTEAITKAATSISAATSSGTVRMPLLRRSSANAGQLAIESLAPRMENPSKYAMSKDKGKDHRQAVLDRNRREYKREHKAATRELRLDAAFIEKERRTSKETRDGKARQQRYKNFSWLEQEQAAMNEQVAKGGELLKGGGIGAAKKKARSGKIGIKKGGKFR